MNSKLVDIYTAGNITEAELIRGLLAAHGIQSNISGQYLSGAMGELPAHGLVRLQVESGDFDRARSILDDYESGELALEEQESDLETDKALEDSEPSTEDGFFEA